LRNSITCTFQVKEDEMGGICSKHDRDEKCIQNFGRKSRN
jgi:hypothetical protein